MICNIWNSYQSGWLFSFPIHDFPLWNTQSNCEDLQDPQQIKWIHDIIQNGQESVSFESDWNWSGGAGQFIIYTSLFQWILPSSTPKVARQGYMGTKYVSPDSIGLMHTNSLILNPDPLLSKKKFSSSPDYYQRSHCSTRVRLHYERDFSSHCLL